MHFTIIKYEAARWLSDPHGGPDIRMEDGSCEIHLYDNIDTAAAAWADIQWSYTGDTILMINGKLTGARATHHHQLLLKDEVGVAVFTEEELAAVKKIDEFTTQTFAERSHLQRLRATAQAQHRAKLQLAIEKEELDRMAASIAAQDRSLNERREAYELMKSRMIS